MGYDPRSIGSLEAEPSGHDRATTQAYIMRVRQLEEEQRFWLEEWKLLAEQIAPGSVRATPEDRRLAAERIDDVINATPLLGKRVMAAGLMAGLSNPADPWFKLKFSDPNLNDYGPAQRFLSAVEHALQTMFAQSNVYNGLHTVYEHLGFGVAAMLVEERGPKSVSAFNWPIGSYALAMNAELRVDTAARWMSMTVGQMVRFFGLEACSNRVQTHWKRRQYEQHIDVLRVIEPNEYPDPQKMDWGGMPWRSVWMERGAEAKLLRRKGYREFPVLAPRWGPDAEDTYARGPGLQGLGDARQLQHAEKRKLQILDRIATPPMQQSGGLSSPYVGLQPGDVTVVDDIRKGGITPLYQIPPGALKEVREEIATLEMRQKQIWYFDLWLALSGDDRKQRATATEIAEVHAEKLVQLGPTTQRLHYELLDPLIDRCSAILIRQSMPYWARGEDGPLPLPPEDIRGIDLRVEYISPLAMAQRAVGITAQERFYSVIGNMSAKVPAVIDKVDWDKAVEKYGRAIGIDPEIVIDQDIVDQRRAAKAKAAQQQQAMAQAPDAAKAAQVLSQTDVRGDSALTRLLGASGATP